MGRCEKLKWNRRKLGMTQRELGDKIGVSHSTICKLENDETAWITLRDSTDDLIYEKLRTLGSWQSDIGSIFKDDVSKIDIREIRKKVRDKRQEMGLSQKELGAMLGIDFTTISHYENHDKYWKNKNSRVAYKLIQFVEGKYDVEEVEEFMEEESAIIETQIEEKVTDIMESTDGIGYTLTTTETRTLETAPKESEEDTLLQTFNSVVDILQDRLTEPNLNEISRKTYISMIAGVCDGYLEHQ